VKVRFKRESTQQEPAAALFGLPMRRSGIRPSPLAGIGSVALHVAGFWMLGLVSYAPPGPPVAYRLTVVPLQTGKLIWYRSSDQLPEVTSGNRAADAKQKTTAVRRKQAISVDSPQAVEGKQFIWQPPPKIELQREVRSPNLLAFTPAPARPVRDFVAPEVPRSSPERPAALLPEASPLAGALPSTDPLPLVGALPGAPKRPTRQFVPPPARSESSGTVSGLEPAPDLGTRSERQQTSLAVISLDPAHTPEIPLPEGSRPSRFSAGPQSEGKGAENNASIVVPGLNISGGGAPSTPVVVNPSRKASQPVHEPSSLEWAKTSSGKDSRHMARSMMSAALAPGSRVLRAPLEQRFRDRPVYATSFAVGAAGSAEWVIWFALKGTAEGLYFSVRPPVPWNRQPEEPDDHARNGHVQVAAVIDRDGHPDSLVVVQCSDETLRARATQTVQQWEFLPALRNGEPVAVDALIDITFRPTPSTR
jgi:TonB-like protein